MSYEPPEGWITATLGDLTTKGQYGWTTSAATLSQGKGIRLLRTTDISSGHVDWSAVPGCRTVPPDSSKYLLSPGDIVVSRAGSVGVSHVLGPCPPSVFASYLIRFRTLGGVPSGFVGLYLQTKDYWNSIAEEAAGIALPNINASKLSSLALPVPPVAEQRRIVHAVENLLAQVDVARGRLAKLPVILKRFRQSVLAGASTGRLTDEWRERTPASHDDGVGRSRTADAAVDDLSDGDIPGSWSRVRAESLCEPTRPITYGVIKLGPKVDGGVPTLRSSNVRPLVIDLSSVKAIERRIADQYSRTYLRGGEVLVTVRGTLGGVAVASSDLTGYNISREVAQLPLLETVNPHFVMYAIASRASQKWLTERAKGVAYTGINIEDLRRLPLPLPPQPEQDEIVRRVDRLLALGDSIEHRVAAASAGADALAQSILAKAFRGELVPTEAELARAEGRNYESAEALLTRIHTERNASVLPKGRQRARLAQGRPVSRGRTE